MAVNRLPFSEVPLKDSESDQEVQPIKIKKERRVKRIVHFSDGVLEEYSTDEEEEEPKVEKKIIIDPKTLAWIPYIWFHMSNFGTMTLSVCDYVGERLAWVLGITSPKYQYEIDEAKRMAEEEEKQKKIEDEEYAGWKLPSDKPDQPSNIHISEPRVTYNEELNKDISVPSISSSTEVKLQSDSLYETKPITVHNSDILSAETLVDPQSLHSINKIETPAVSKTYDLDFNTISPTDSSQNNKAEIPKIEGTAPSNICETTKQTEPEEAAHPLVTTPVVEAVKEAEDVEPHVRFDDNITSVLVPKDEDFEEEEVLDVVDIKLVDAQHEEEDLKDEQEEELEYEEYEYEEEELDEIETVDEKNIVAPNNEEEKHEPFDRIDDEKEEYEEESGEETEEYEEEEIETEEPPGKVEGFMEGVAPPQAEALKVSPVINEATSQVDENPSLPHREGTKD